MNFIFIQYERKIKMKIWTFFKNRLVESCIYFTITQFIMSAILYFAEKASGGGLVFQIQFSLLIFGFSFVLSLLNLIFKIKKLNIPAKLLIHSLSTLAVFILIFAVATKQLSNPQSLLFVLFFAAILYVVIAVAVLIIRAVKNKKASEQKTYDPQFEKKNG